jgi:hypothetical protein
MNDKLAKPTIEMVTLKQLCAELKVDPREGKMVAEEGLEPPTRGL